MNKNIIIGAGFSAAITKILIGKNAKVIGTLNHNNLNKKFFRRKSLECNKLFSKRTFSYGTIKFNLKKGKMHDRLTLGGNSTIWGGHINLKKISKKILNLLRFHKVCFQKLSLIITGTKSTDKNIVQIQTKSGEILKAQHLIKKITNGYILNFFINKKKIFIIFITLESFKIKKIQVKNLFLCLGSVQLLDLLYRSKFLKENDIIEFSEFYHEFKFNFINSEFTKKKATTIRYIFSRALGHFLGIQYFSKYLKLLNFFPICVDQIFYNKKENYKLKIKNGMIIEKNSQKYPIKNFGKSVHYCNMRVNGVSINKFLSKINPNILGIGMSFIDQTIPGPISNEIILDIIKKIK